MTTTDIIENVTDVSFSWTSPTLRINWTGTGDSYSVRYRSSADTDWSAPVTGTDDTGIDISGLTEGNAYFFSVTTTITGVHPVPDSTSLADTYGYVIPQGLTAPSGCAVTDEGATWIKIEWTGTLPSGGYYLVTVQPQQGTAYDLQTTATSLTIQNLNPGMTYKFFVSVVQNQETLKGDCYIDKAKICC